MSESAAIQSCPSCEKVYSTSFKEIFLDKNQPLLLSIWRQSSHSMTDTDYINDAKALLELIKKYKVKGLVTDVRELRYDIHPDLQKWYAEEICGDFEKYGLKRVGIVIDDNLNKQNAIEGIVDNRLWIRGVLKTEHRFFSDLPSARHWVLK